MSTLNKEIGERVKYIRTKIMKMEKQEPFAILVGTSRQMICNIENGNSSLSMDTLKSIALKTGVTTDFIVLGITTSTNLTISDRVKLKCSIYAEEELLKAFQIIGDVIAG